MTTFIKNLNVIAEPNYKLSKWLVTRSWTSKLSFLSLSHQKYKKLILHSLGWSSLRAVSKILPKTSSFWITSWVWKMIRRSLHATTAMLQGLYCSNFTNVEYERKNVATRCIHKSSVKNLIMTKKFESHINGRILRKNNCVKWVGISCEVISGQQSGVPIQQSTGIDYWDSDKMEKIVTCIT